MSARRAAPLDERRSSFVALPILSLSSFRSHLPFLVRIGKKRGGEREGRGECQSGQRRRGRGRSKQRRVEIELMICGLSADDAFIKYGGGASQIDGL